MSLCRRPRRASLMLPYRCIEEVFIMKKKNDLVEVVFVLDRSGSMCGLEADTIGGFNNMLRKQKRENENIIWSTVLFDHLTQVVHDRVPVSRVNELDDRTYYVRGATALLDAVGGAIRHIANCHRHARKEDVPKKTLFVITTDGMENSSVQYSYREVRRMIEHERKKYDWEFIFLGANMDAVEVAGRMGIDARKSARYHNDEAGVANNFEAVADMVCDVACFGEIKEERLERVRADYRNRK